MDKAKLQELLDSMTLQEKVGQMFQGSAPMFGTVGAVTGNVGMEWVTPEIVYTMGSVLNVFSIERMKKLQDFHLQHSKIPLIFMMDIICGYNTIFPLSPAILLNASYLTFLPASSQEICNSLEIFSTSF